MFFIFIFDKLSIDSNVLMISFNTDRDNVRIISISSQCGPVSLATNANRHAYSVYAIATSSNSGYKQYLCNATKLHFVVSFRCLRQPESLY